MKRLVVLLVAAGVLGGCSTLDKLNPFSSAPKVKMAELTPIQASADLRLVWQGRVAAAAALWIRAGGGRQFGLCGRPRRYDRALRRRQGGVAHQGRTDAFRRRRGGRQTGGGRYPEGRGIGLRCGWQAALAGSGKFGSAGAAADRVGHGHRAQRRQPHLCLRHCRRQAALGLSAHHAGTDLAQRRRCRGSCQWDTGGLSRRQAGGPQRRQWRRHLGSDRFVAARVLRSWSASPMS